MAEENRRSRRPNEFEAEISAVVGVIRKRFKERNNTQTPERVSTETTINTGCSAEEGN